MVNTPTAAPVIVAPTPLVPLLYVYAGSAAYVATTTDAFGSSPCATVST